VEKKDERKDREGENGGEDEEVKEIGERQGGYESVGGEE
jgi:hypothetical protein